MTVAQNISGRAVEVHHPPPSEALLVVRWTIDRGALLRARPGLIRPGAGPIELRWLVERECDRITASAALLDSDLDSDANPAVTPLLESRSDMMRPDPVWIDDGRMVHVDLPGLLIVSLRRERDGTRLLYARTRVLAESLGLPGGRYEPLSASDVAPGARQEPARKSR